MSFRSGQTVGEYEFIDIVRSDKQGVTWKVLNREAQRFEALEVLPAALANDQEQVERFLRRTKVQARLQHPNISAVYATTELSGLLVMTSELLEGVPLSERLDLGPLPLEEAIRITRQALDALAAAHEAGIVHREICPANLWITPDGTVKLTGFSRAKTASDTQLTQAGTAVGPVKYISPEQVKGTVDPDPRSDLYSLGVVLYELATGKVPFDSPSQFDVMLAHVSQTPMPPRHHKEDLPAAFDAIVLRAMAKDPAQRYQSAEEFDDALAAFTAGEPAPEPMTAPEPKPAPAPPPAAEMPAAAPVIARRTGLPTLTTAALMFLGAFLVLLVLMSLR